MSNKKPKVVFLTHTSKYGGAERSLVDIIINSKVDKEFFSLEDGELSDDLRRVGVNVSDSYLIGRDSVVGSRLHYLLKMFLFSFRVRKYFSGFDIVYANSNKAYFFAIFLKIFCLCPIAIVWHIRDSFDDQHFGFSRYFLCAMSKIFCAKVICNSHYSRSCYINSWGSVAKSDVIYNGFKVEDYSYSNLNKSTPGYSFVSLSRISPWKGQLEILQVLAAFKHIPWRLTICGGALFGEEEYELKLLEFVRYNNLQDRVEFTGHIADVPLFLQDHKFDALIHNSLLPEPFGRCIVESALSGIEIIAPNNGGIPEILNPRINYCPYVRLFKANDMDDLTLNISNFFLEDMSDQKRVSMLKLIANACSEKFSYEELSKKINTVLLGLK